MTLSNTTEQRLRDAGWVEVEGDWRSPWTGNLYEVESALRIQLAVDGEEEE